MDELSSAEISQAGWGSMETEDEICGKEGGLKTHRAGCADTVNSVLEVILVPSLIRQSGPVPPPGCFHADSPGFSVGRRVGSGSEDVCSTPGAGRGWWEGPVQSLLGNLRKPFAEAGLVVEGRWKSFLLPHLTLRGFLKEEGR